MHSKTRRKPSQQSWIRFGFLLILLFAIKRKFIDVSIIDDDFRKAAEGATQLPQLSKVRCQDCDIRGSVDALSNEVPYKGEDHVYLVFIRVRG